MERSLLMSISGSGFAIASAAVYPLSGFLCQHFGWDFIFYIPGATGLLWVAVALFLVYEWPEDHPRVETRELTFIQKYRAVHRHSDRSKQEKIPWASMLLSPAVWALFIANFSCFWCFLTVGTYLPTYLNEVLQLNISENGFLSALPFISMMAFHFLIAMLFDWLRKKNRYSITFLRKTFNSLGMFPAAFCMAMIALLPCDSLTGSVILFTLSQTFLEFAWMGGYMLTIFEVAPRFTSILTGLTNSFAYLAGFTSAAVVSWMTSEGTRQQWLNVFYLSAGINAFGGLVYLAFGKCTLLSWAAAPAPVENRREKGCIDIVDTVVRDKDEELKYFESNVAKCDQKVQN